jgi:hypothetical protein
VHEIIGEIRRRVTFHTLRFSEKQLLPAQFLWRRFCRIEFGRDLRGPGGKFQISTNGGSQPRWNKNGKEIFYISMDSKLMAAPVKLAPDGNSIESGTPAVLFPVRIAGGPVTVAGFIQQFAVSPRGQRFLVNLETGEDKTSPITLIVNWHPPKL